VNIVNGIIKVAFIVTAAIALVFFGWCLKGYQVRRNNAE
jgi:hypothetical protein